MNERNSTSENKMSGKVLDSLSEAYMKFQEIVILKWRKMTLCKSNLSVKGETI